MKLTAIQELVERIAGCEITKSRQTAVINARYVFMLLAIEEHHARRNLWRHLDTNRDTTNYSLKKANVLLQVDKPFKALYLRCIAEITKHEQ